MLKRAAALLLLLHAALRCPAFELTVCTTVMNEVAYMPEWIEYYALQGATRIVIGNHRSTDSLGMLAKLYAGRVPAVEVHANNGEQTPWLNWCARRHKRSQWILFADNDEFFWSPQHGTLAAYLATVPADVTQVFGFGVRFGFGSCAMRHKLRVSATRIEVPSRQPRGIHKIPLNETGELPFPLVTEMHTRRPPNPHLPGESDMLENIRRSGLVRACNATLMRALYGDAFSGENPCLGHESGKSFVRGYAVWKLGHPHYAQLRKGISHRETNLTELRFNHYWVRCKSDAYQKAAQWKKHDPVEWVEHAGLLREAVHDTGLLRYVQPLKQRLAQLL